MNIQQYLIAAIAVICVNTQPEKFDKTERFCNLLWQTTEGKQICDPMTWECSYMEQKLPKVAKTFTVDKNDKKMGFYTDLASSAEPSTLGFYSLVYPRNKFETIKQDTLLDLGKEAPNFARVNESLAGYHGCYKNSASSWGSTLYYGIMDKYSLPLTYFLSSHKKYDLPMKITYFKKIGEIFKGLLVAVARLHTTEFEGEVPFYVKRVGLSDIGVYSNTSVILEDVNSNMIVIRKTENITKNPIVPHKVTSNFILKTMSNRRYKADELKNINYAQIVDLFLTVLNRDLASKFNVADCFAETELDRIFFINNCPAFMSILIGLLPIDERKALAGILKDNNIHVNAKETQNAVFHLFDFIHNYNRTPEQYNPSEVQLNLKEYSKDNVPTIDSVLDKDNQQMPRETPADEGQLDKLDEDILKEEEAKIQGKEEGESAPASEGFSRKKVFIIIGIVFAAIAGLGAILWFTLL